MGYQRINTIVGWFLFLFSLIVYTLTVEPTASFWDAGEFIACAYKLEVSHPPGAPFYLLLGRLFSLLAGDDVTQVAYWVNYLSVLSSAFFILFLFWSITHLAKKMINPPSESLDSTILIMLIGTVGSLSCVFLDSFWFSAVESEVYAFSAFFTAFVIWAILKWEDTDKENARQVKWLLLIAYMMGLSIGVHLLNLVTIFALGLVVYFKYNEKITKKGITYTMLICAVIVVFILEGIIPGFPSVVGKLEVMFVNSLGLPFGSGAIFFILVFVGGLVYGIIYSIKKNKYLLNVCLLGLVFIMIGYSSYMIIPIRSSFDTPIDENDPENIVSFVSYLKREQYGSRPLFYGQYYTAGVKGVKKLGTVYKKGKNKYEVIDYKVEQEFDPRHTTIFPRMYSSSPAHVNKYKEVIGATDNQRPTFKDNIYYLFKHQLGYQYFRYFMWNFSGRASDFQNAEWLGINDIFKSSSKTLSENKGRNIFYGLPFILGLLGAFVHFKRDKKMFSVVAVLFFMTGMALTLYLNPPPIEPRARDYIYAGSFYIYTIWIGFGVYGVYEIIKKFLKQKVVAASLAGIVCLFVPLQMVSQTWDDHDRSDRYYSIDSAKNYLESCRPNAILFTGGDNDTFPLWYVQEVEGIRTDVRVVVLSYLNTDWYVNQLMRDAYESSALPFGLTAKNYQRGGLNDYLPFVQKNNIKGAINAVQFLKLIREVTPQIQITTSSGSTNIVPSKDLYLANIDTNKIKSVIPEEFHDKITDRIDFKIKRSGLEKKDLAIMDLIVNANWERPIYFNGTSMQSVSFDVKKYLVQEGLAYRFLPIVNDNKRQETLVDTDRMYDNLVNKFSYRGLDDPSIYYTRDYFGFVNNLRHVYYSLASALLIKGEKEQAKKILDSAFTLISSETFSYDYYTAAMATLYLSLGDVETANFITGRVFQESGEKLQFMMDNGVSDFGSFQRELFIMNEIIKSYRTNSLNDKANEYEDIFRKYYMHFIEKKS